MRGLHTLMAYGAIVALTANTDQGSEPEGIGRSDPSAPAGGQIALTARNSQDGTWAITRGPGGEVLESGLKRDEALAIIGAPASPMDPDNHLEVALVARRKKIEARAAEATNAVAFEADPPEPAKAHQIGGPDTLVGDGSGDALPPFQGDGLASENAALREENEALKAQIAKFDPDGDGKVGGAVARAKGDDGLTKVEIIADLEGMQVEFDPRAKKDELLALRNEHRAKRDAQATEG